MNVQGSKNKALLITNKIPAPFIFFSPTFKESQWYVLNNRKMDQLV